MADAAPQRWTTPDATPAVNGGFVAYGDYLKLKAEAAALRKLARTVYSDKYIDSVIESEGKKR